MRPKTTTIILTSSRLYSWASINEVLPLIVKSWMSTECDSHQVSVFNIDLTDLHTILKHAISADNIVFSCFSSELFKLAQVLRFKMKLNSRFIIHLFNHSTIACWPMRYFGGKDLFRKSDQFISTCRNDRRCLKLSYPDAHVTTIPFPLGRIGKDVRAKEIQKVIPFIYIGRLSSQKQIHSLLFSFFLLNKKCPNLSWRLKLVGKADHLGSPNMGMKETGYLNKLKNLCKQLNISKHVEFLGFKDRNEIEKLLSKNKYIFASASLHSDENFGVSACQALMAGHLAVLSNWGGHSDFKIHFQNQVFLCPVNRTSNGPAIQAHQFCLQLVKASKRYKVNVGDQIPIFYDERKISLIKRKLAQLPIKCEEPLRATALADLVLKRAKAAISRKEKSKKQFSIFTGYDDPLVSHFFRVYGMGYALNTRHFKKLMLQPWVRLDQKRIYVCDYHRGHQCLVKRSITKNTSRRIQTFDGHRAILHQSDFQWLISRGYIEIFH